MPDNVIDLRAPWKEAAGVTRSRGHAIGHIDADALEIDLRTDKLFELIAPRLVEKYKEAVGKAKGGPTKGTLKRRGAGPLFNVTGRFLEGVAFNVEGRGKKAMLTLTTGRLSKTVVRWLQYRVPGVRARNLLTASRKIIEQLVREGIVRQKGMEAA